MSLYGPQVSHRTATAAVRLRLGVDAKHSTSRQHGQERPCGSTHALQRRLSAQPCGQHTTDAPRALKTDGRLHDLDACFREWGDVRRAHRGSRRRHGARGARTPYSLIQGIKSGKAQGERAKGGFSRWMADPANSRKEGDGETTRYGP